MSISAIILTYNEELHIERCVRNLQQVCQQVFVVDSFSTDDTCEIAERCGATIFQNKYVNQAQQFQWALDNCPIKTPWTLRMDADEYLTEELIDEIQNKLISLPPDIAGIYLTFRVKFLGRILRFGSLRPVRILRIWRTGKAYMEQRWMDERMVLTEGKAINFKHRFIDENLTGLTAWTQKHNNYSNREIITELDKRYHFFKGGAADELSARNKQKSTYYHLPRFLRATFYFLARYIFFLGFLDGLRGLIWLTLQAYWYRFLVDAKLYELEKRLGKSPTRDQVVKYVHRFYGIEISNIDTNYS